MAFVTEIEPTGDLKTLLNQLDEQDVVLDFSFYRSEAPCEYESHFNAAYYFLEAAREQHQKRYATIDFSKYPLAEGYVYRWNPDELHGSLISFADFMGADATEPTPLGNQSWSIPNADGLQTAFFFPPYGLRKPHNRNLLLFDQLTDWLFADAPRDSIPIYSWSTQCSSYFDAGLEWWGAFMWTISRPGSDTLTVIAASSTD